MSYSFDAPWVFLLLPLPYLVYWLVPPYRQESQSLRIPFFRELTTAANLSPQAGSIVIARQRLQTISGVVVWILILLALAQPQRLGEPIVQERSARDLVLAVDISGSMEARDFRTEDDKPMSRLDAVKNVLDDFIAQRAGDRIGLVIFGTRAYVQAPFTEDLAGLSEFLAQIQPSMAGPNTAIGDAIGLSLRMFRASEVEERQVILLSDGADTGSKIPPLTSAEFAEAEGIRITTIGVGDPNGSGSDKVDLDALRDIAAKTGGTYFYASDQDALTATYAEIDAQTPRKQDSISYRPHIDLAYIPMLIASLIIGLTTLVLRIKSGGRAR